MEEISMLDDGSTIAAPIESVAELQERVAAPRQGVGDSQIASKQKEEQWFRSPSVLISLLALLFSFGTTFVSYLRTHQQDIHDARSELRALIEQSDHLQQENIDYMQRYSKAPLIQNQVSGLLNTENALIAKQAAAVIDRIPNYVTASEYHAVANALFQSSLAEKAIKVAQKGIEVANDANDEVDLLRFYGNLLFLTGNAEKGREQYKKALDVFGKYKGYNTYYIESTHLITELGWASSEFSSRQCGHISAHLTEAQRHLVALGPGALTDSYAGQLTAVRQQAKSCVADQQANAS
jgi:tetratricopeptide (TPR) repeat protein